MRHRYLVVVEKGPNNYSAYAPDVPGCVTVGDSIEETLSNMREALELYFEAAREQSQDTPHPYAVHAAFVEFETPATTKANSVA